MWYQRSVVLASSHPPNILFVENPLTGAGFLTARLTAIKVLAKYLWLLVWPRTLSWDYSYNQIPLVQGSPQDWAAFLTVVAVLIVAVILFRRNRLCLFFAGFAFVAIVPVSNLIILIGTMMAERFLYLPSIGFAACIVLGAFEVGRRVQSRALAPVFLCLLLAAYGARTLVRNADWKDPLALVTSGVHTSPNSFKTHDALASEMFESDHTFSNIDSVIEEARKSVAILDAVPNALNTPIPFTNTGLYYERRGTRLARRDPQGEALESIQSYQQSLQFLIRARSIDKLAGARYLKEEKARGKLDSEIVPPGLPQLYQELALTYWRLGDLRNAYEAAIQTRLLAPDRADYGLLSAILLAANRKDEAAIVLIEGFLITHDSNLISRLRSLYVGGLDPKGCAFTESPTGPNLNDSCEVVHIGLCKASTELMDIYRRNQKQDVVAEIEKNATEEFGCPATRRD